MEIENNDGFSPLLEPGRIFSRTRSQQAMNSFAPNPSKLSTAMPGLTVCHTSRESADARRRKYFGW